MDSLFTPFQIKNRCFWKPNPYYNKVYSDDIFGAIERAADSIRRSASFSRPDTYIVNRWEYYYLLRDKTTYLYNTIVEQYKKVLSGEYQREKENDTRMYKELFS